MGKQVLFIASPDDRRSMLAFLEEFEAVLCYVAPEPPHELIMHRTVERLITGDLDANQYHVVDCGKFGEGRDAEKTSLQSYCAQAIRQPPSLCGCFEVTFDCYHFPKLPPKHFPIGRLFTKTDFVGDDGKLWLPQKEHLDLYEHTAKWVRKEFCRADSWNLYIGPDALRQGAVSGVALGQVPPVKVKEKTFRAYCKKHPEFGDLGGTERQRIIS